VCHSGSGSVLLNGSQLENAGSTSTWYSQASAGTLADGPYVTNRFHKLLKRAGLPAMRFHHLRHACASLLLVQGVHPRVVMETLGHSQISLTTNTYSNVLPCSAKVPTKCRRSWRSPRK
jgi:site-specific recombinase XerD